jgi:hypothetical protein
MVHDSGLCLVGKQSVTCHRVYSSTSGNRWVTGRTLEPNEPVIQHAADDIGWSDLLAKVLAVSLSKDFGLL